MSFYEILGINQNATKQDIKKAYLKLSLKYHPDKNNNDTTNEFLKIKLAYETLFDDNKRTEYDNNNNTEFSRYIEDLFSSGFDFYNNPELYDIFTSQINIKNNYFDNILKDFLKNITNEKIEKNNFSNIVSMLPPKLLNTIKNFSIPESVPKQPLNIRIMLNVSLKDIYNKQMLNVPVKRVIDNKIINTTYSIKSWVLKQVYKQYGNQYDNKIGDLQFNIIPIEEDGFKFINLYDIYYEKSISFYDCLSGVNFKLKLLDNSIITITKDKVYDNYELFIKGKGIYNERRKKYGNLYIKFKLNYPELDDTKLNKLKEIL